MRLALPWAERVHAEIHDVLGRTVFVLVDDQAFEPGSHVLTWNGRNRTGDEAPTGVYFIRVRAGEESRAHKIVLTR